MTLDGALNVVAAEVDVGDDAMRHARPVGELLQPAGLADGVFGPDRSLDVNHSLDIRRRVSEMKSSAQ